MLLHSGFKSFELPGVDDALPDRDQAVTFNPIHFVNSRTIVEPVLTGIEKAVFGLGCFWGAERLFWQMPGVYSTAVGYAGGITTNPSYEDVCTGGTGHTEVVLVFFDPLQLSYPSLLAAFWESHDPTQGMAQGNDRGTQYRSAIYTTQKSQEQEAQHSAECYQQALSENGYQSITTEIKQLDHLYYAEDQHQQYLAKNPAGYCALAGTGICLTAKIEV